MHTRDLTEQGISLSKLMLLPVWREAATLFSIKECAGLAWAETVTRVGDTGSPNFTRQ